MRNEPKNPFAKLAALREQLPPGEVDAPRLDPREPESPARTRGRVVVRIERKGRGGKTVTALESSLSRRRGERSTSATGSSVFKGRSPAVRG